MLELKSIKKDYPAGSSIVHALKGISLRFREHEFVSILGPSGCGKTTMLNLIGGLDQYTEGDLVINGRSTKDFRDRDWDAYRNHSVGFVFQSYNLIPHQTVLQNVELALTLSGVSKAERRRRAAKALEEVGLGDQLKKKPGQMSGGQMQRVAIARALVNDPAIILADEPTGALDTETSVQVMDILKEVAKTRLVIMVTHNPDLAETYSTRIIRMLDGEIKSDSAPLTEAETFVLHTNDRKKASDAKKQRMPSMSLPTAFGLSLKNLVSKKGRTLLTAFAGSIGIIGIALILALSTGINDYIAQVQQDTLSSYPLTIEAETVDMSAMMISLMGASHGEGESHALDKVYSSTVMYELMDSMLNAETSTNDLKSFKTYLDNGGGGISDLAGIHYTYDFDFDIYTKDVDGIIIKSDVMTLMQDAMSVMYGGDYSSFFNSSMGSMYQDFDVWQELLSGEEGEPVGKQVQEQYDLLYGTWPKSYDEVLLFVDSRNEISDLMLYALGLMSSAEMKDALTAMADGKGIEGEQMSWTYDELCGISFKMILPSEYYRKDTENGGYVDMSATEAGMDYLYNSKDVGVNLKVVGIARPNEDATSTMVTGAIGYTNALTTYAINETAAMEIVREQLADDTVDVFCNLPFATGEEKEPSDEQKQTDITVYLKELSTAEKADVYTDLMCQPSESYVSGVVEQQMTGMTRETIEEMILQQYSTEMGVDAETIQGYISEMTDQQLFDQVAEAMKAQVYQQYAAGVAAQMAAMTQEQLSGALDLLLDNEPSMLQAMSLMPLETWQFNYLYDNHMPPTLSEGNYQSNLDTLGYVDLESPSTVNLYASTFADKDLIEERIQAYNDKVDEEQKIEYTDYVGLIMSSVTSIINAITYVLIAFVAISLVVSSIMIGVITLISVQERTKEIGILRAIGASKKNVSSMFVAETVIIGFAAGVLGVFVTWALCFPINAIIQNITGIASLAAVLPWQAALILIGISMLLTVFAGIIPSRSAAKKDPVVALRTE